MCSGKINNKFRANQILLLKYTGNHTKSRIGTLCTFYGVYHVHNEFSAENVYAAHSNGDVSYVARHIIKKSNFTKFTFNSNCCAVFFAITSGILSCFTKENAKLNIWVVKVILFKLESFLSTTYKHQVYDET